MKTFDAWHNGAALVLGSILAASAGCSTLNSQTASTTTVTSAAADGASGDRYDGPKASLAVSAFAIKAPKAKDLSGDGLADMLATALFESNRFIVLERQAFAAVTTEQKLDVRRGPPVVSGIGQIQGADLLVIASVTEFEPGTAGVTASGADHAAFTKAPEGKDKVVKLLGKFLATSNLAVSHVAIDVRVVDTRTSRVVAATTVGGRATDVDLSGLGELAGTKLDVGISVHARTPMEKAIRLAIREAVQFIGSRTPNEYYHYRDTLNGASWPSAGPPRTPSEATSAPGLAPTAPTTTPVEVLYIKATAANVRGGPGTNTAIVTTVKRATKVVVLDNHRGWYRVRLENGREGWVAASVTSPEAP